jgi:hypothetical protein
MFRCNRTQWGGHTFAAHAHIDLVTRKYGAEAAKELTLFHRSQIFAMKGAAENENLDCDAVLTRYFETLLTQPQADEFKKQYEGQVKLG